MNEDDIFSVEVEFVFWHYILILDDNKYLCSPLTFFCHVMLVGSSFSPHQGGMYVLQLLDWYSAGFCVLIIAIVECCAINWLYGEWSRYDVAETS